MPVAEPEMVARAGIVDAAALRHGLARCRAAIGRHAEKLTALDDVLGDGDHGENLLIGFGAVDDLLAELPEDTPPGPLLHAVGHQLVAAVGGASGPLYGTAFRAAGERAGDREALDGPLVAAVLETASDALARRGRCSVGDKTILDTLRPAADAMTAAVEAGADVEAAYRAAVRAAARGMRRTRGMVARRGLAQRLGPRSIGHLDPGAVSCLLLLAALGSGADGAGTQGSRRADT